MPTATPRHEFRVASIGGLVAGSTLFVIILGVGSVGDFQALRLIEATLPTARFLTSTAIAAGITILALILTLLSFNLSTDIDFDRLHYRRVGYITTLTVAMIVISTLVLIAVTLPIEEVEELSSIYNVLYYLLAASIATVGALVVAAALMIGETVRSLIRVARPDASAVVTTDGED